MDHMYYENPIWVFQRKIPILKPLVGMYSSTFNKSGSYEGVMHYSCGTGRSKSDYYPQSEWNIDKENALIINENAYEILFISEDYMFLINKTNHNSK